MFEGYRIVKTLSEGLVGVESSQYGRQLWHTAKTRKVHRCRYCGTDILKGVECWAPITHDLNRHHRLHTECLE